MIENKKAQFFKSIKIPFLLLLIMWIIQIFQISTGINLGAYGVYPRHILGIKGILTSPFIHSARDIMHIINNSVPFFVSMMLIFLFYRKIAVKSIFMIYILTGLFVWLFGRNVFHIGASGVVYGMVSFIFWNGVFRRNMQSIAIALIIVFLYSGMIVGILPNQDGISWESHLIGGLVGILVSYLFRNQVEKAPVSEYPYSNMDEEKEHYFLDRDTFMKTKQERKNQSDWFSNSTW